MPTVPKTYVHHQTPPSALITLVLWSRYQIRCASQGVTEWGRDSNKNLSFFFPNPNRDGEGYPFDYLIKKYIVKMIDLCLYFSLSRQDISLLTLARLNIQRPAYLCLWSARILDVCHHTRPVSTVYAERCVPRHLGS